jgi:hypothetical protein
MAARRPGYCFQFRASAGGVKAGDKLGYNARSVAVLPLRGIVGVGAMQLIRDVLRAQIKRDRQLAV